MLCYVMLYIHTYIHTFIHAYKQCKNACMHTYIHTYITICITYIYTHMLPSSSLPDSCIFCSHLLTLRILSPRFRILHFLHAAPTPPYPTNLCLLLSSFLCMSFPPFLRLHVFSHRSHSSSSLVGSFYGLPVNNEDDWRHPPPLLRSGTGTIRLYWSSDSELFKQSFDVSSH